MTQEALSRAVWRKSSHSGNGGNCVEIADLSTGIAIRDSKNPDGPRIVLPLTQWTALVHTIKDSCP
ncbi:protein of unknown function [Thermomonospora echinospora]|uniref:DUF397 domain-containing protein n=1 Tax=Thermomonospora echinospora TaxID=1992 RepID=A0A1H6E1W0_9ACTN|nr:DUF397 domain-containing protein [Thermomonospora echinospora]SEG91163.1 protein of unknown function [Thermomonospora echinospora]